MLLSNSVQSHSFIVLCSLLQPNTQIKTKSHTLTLQHCCNIQSRFRSESYKYSTTTAPVFATARRSYITNNSVGIVSVFIHSQ